MTEFSKDYQPPTRGTPEEMTKGRKNKKLMTDALVLALNREAKDAEGVPTKNLALIAEKLVAQAKVGDIQAIKEVFDRTEGKAAQAIQLSGADDGPLQIQIIKFSDAKNTDSE